MTSDNQAGDDPAHAILQQTLSEDKTVWVYINTAREVGDVDHLKVLPPRSAGLPSTTRRAWRSNMRC